MAREMASRSGWHRRGKNAPPGAFLCGQCRTAAGARDDRDRGPFGLSPSIARRHLAVMPELSVLAGVSVRGSGVVATTRRAVNASNVRGARWRSKTSFDVPDFRSICSHADRQQAGRRGDRAPAGACGDGDRAALAGRAVAAKAGRDVEEDRARARRQRPYLILEMRTELAARSAPRAGGESGQAASPPIVLSSSTHSVQNSSRCLSKK